MLVDVRTLLIVLLVVLLATAISACSTLGAGRATLIRASAPSPVHYNGSEFASLLVATGAGNRLIGLAGSKPFKTEDWEDFKQRQVSGIAASIGGLGISVRDQSATPPLLSVDASRASAADITKLLLDPKLSAAEKAALTQQLRDHFLSLPETPSTLVQVGAQGGALRYHYFPLLTLDLTASLQVADPLARFEYVAAAIRIPEATNARFINFAPKAADLYDFTVGQLKQSASLAAKLDATDALSAVDRSAIADKNGESTRTSGTDFTQSATRVGGLSFSLSDELTRELRAALDARAAGIHDNGKLFVVELRGNDRRRISGTVSHDVMLEIPTEVKKIQPAPGQTNMLAYESSEPKDSTVVAEVRLVGVVRHVRKVGRTGVFKRVPEPMNDETFHEVIVKELKVPLWQFNMMPLARLTESAKPNLLVVSNETDASFSVLDTSGKVLASGVGRSNSLIVPTTGKIRIVFGRINRALSSATYSMSAPEVEVEIGKDLATAVGSYTINKQEEK